MIKQMERFARTDQGVISLGQGIPAGTTGQHIRQAVITALKSNTDIDRYSDPLGIPELRKALSDQLITADMQYAPDEIIITAGAIEAINAALLTFIDNIKYEVIVPTPSYSAYQRCIMLAGGTPVPIPLEESQNWQLPLSSITAKISSRTAAILICNPNNPTGTVYDRRTLDQLSSLAKEHGFMLICDEVYGNVLYDGNDHYSPAARPQFKSNIIRVMSFSKDFNMTGWRIGYMHSHRDIVRRIVPVHDTLINCAPVISQYAALAAVEVSEATIANNKSLYGTNRAIMKQYLDDMPEWFSYQAPAGGYFFFPKFNFQTTDHELCLRLAKEAKVVAVPGSDFGSEDSRHIRLCFGRPTHDIIEGMQRIKEYLHENSTFITS